MREGVGRKRGARKRERIGGDEIKDEESVCVCVRWSEIRGEGREEGGRKRGGRG